MGWASFDRYDTSLFFMPVPDRDAPRVAGVWCQVLFLFDETEPVDTNIYIDTALSEIATIRERVWIFTGDLQYVDTPLLPSLWWNPSSAIADYVRYDDLRRQRDNEQLAL